MLPTLRARSLPYRPEPRYNERVCKRCGITYRIHSIRRDGHHAECNDCRTI